MYALLLFYADNCCFINCSLCAHLRKLRLLPSLYLNTHCLFEATSHAVNRALSGTLTSRNRNEGHVIIGCWFNEPTGNYDAYNHLPHHSNYSQVRSSADRITTNLCASIRSNQQLSVFLTSYS